MKKNIKINSMMQNAVNTLLKGVSNQAVYSNNKNTRIRDKEEYLSHDETKFYGFSHLIFLIA